MLKKVRAVDGRSVNGMMGGRRSSSKGAVDGRAPARMVSLAVDQLGRCRDGATRGLTRWESGSARRGDETGPFPGERGMAMGRTG